MKLTHVLAGLCLGTGTAYAGGFEVLEHGAAATGMVGAFTAKADDPSAIFYNPGGLAGQEGLQIYLGSTVITGFGSGEFGGEETDRTFAPNPLPTAYVSYGVGQFAFGIGAFTRFGLSVEWPDEWAGRLIATRAALNTVTINPTVSWRPLPWLGVGGGLDVTPASVTITRYADLVADEAGLRFAGNTVGLGGNAGVLVGTRELSAGVSYRSGGTLEFDDGTLTFDAPPELSAMLMDTPASADVPLADLVSMGIGFRPTRKVFIQGQADWHNWSRFQELAITTPNPGFALSEPQNWEDAWTFRLGAEFDLDGPLLRAGVGYDMTPIPAETLSPILPDADRFLVSVGVGGKVRRDLAGELSLMGVFFRDRTSEREDFEARYKGFAILTGVALHFDAR
jgi:long-chain fatty acid transport protein